MGGAKNSSIKTHILSYKAGEFAIIHLHFLVYTIGTISHLSVLFVTFPIILKGIDTER